MAHYFFAFWWLIFPISWFILAAWNNWLSYRRRKDELETLKHMAASGKEPPPELVKAVSNPQPEGDDPYHPYYGGGWRARRAYRFGPFWEWRRAIFFGAIAGGLWYWGTYEANDGWNGGIMIATVVMGILAVTSALTALFLTLNPPK